MLQSARAFWPRSKDFQFCSFFRRDCSCGCGFVMTWCLFGSFSFVYQQGFKRRWDVSQNSCLGPFTYEKWPKNNPKKGSQNGHQNKWETYKFKLFFVCLMYFLPLSYYNTPKNRPKKGPKRSHNEKLPLNERVMNGESAPHHMPLKSNVKLFSKFVNMSNGQ